MNYELKSDNVQYRNKIYYFVGCFGAGGRRHWKYCYIGQFFIRPTYTLYNIRIRMAGRRQVTVRFMN